jgi:cytochrome P450
LVANAASYGRPWIVRSIMGEALGQTLFLAENEEWLARRQVVAPVFGRAHVDGLTQAMASAITDHIGPWHEGPVQDMQTELTDLTFRVASRALLGIAPAEEELRRGVQEPFEVVLGWMSHRFRHLAAPPAPVPTRRNRAMRAARAEMRAAVERLVQRRREAGAESFDVLSLMLRSQTADEPRADDDIVSDCIGFLFAGHETTASTLTWALYELATHPEVQDLVAREGDALDLSRSDLFQATEELHYTGGVVEEILRLYPAGVGVARVAKRTTELGGHRIRRGTTVLIAVYPMQRAKAWPEPNTFDPRREFPAQPGSTGGPGYLPFGWGPRRCLGARFATTEVRLVLALLCSRWIFTYEHPEPPRAAVLPSLRIDGPLPLRLTVRNRSG